MSAACKLTIVSSDSSVGSFESFGEHFVLVLRRLGFLTGILKYRNPFFLVIFRIKFEVKGTTGGGVRNEFGTKRGQGACVVFLDFITTAIDGSFKRATLSVIILDAKIVHFIQSYEVIMFEISSEGAFLRQRETLQ